MTRLLYRLFHGPAWLAFIVMGLATGAFALCSFNLFELFHANFHLLATYGMMAAFDGGLLQLVELAFWGDLGLACYVIFKGCLDGLLTPSISAPAALGRPRSRRPRRMSKATGGEGEPSTRFA